MGCKIYNLFHKEDAELCPGGSCEMSKKEEIQKISIFQAGFLILFGVVIATIYFLGIIKKTDNSIGYNSTNETNETCEVPDWAIKIGHEEQYKLHHGCE